MYMKFKKITHTFLFTRKLNKFYFKNKTSQFPLLHWDHKFHCFIETINLIETINSIIIAIYHSSLLFLSHPTLLSLSFCLPLLPRLESRSNITSSVLTLSSLSPTCSNTCLHLSLIHIWRCRRIERCRSRWSPYH